MPAVRSCAALLVRFVAATDADGVAWVVPDASGRLPGRGAYTLASHRAVDLAVSNSALLLALYPAAAHARLLRRRLHAADEAAGGGHARPAAAHRGRAGDAPGGVRAQRRAAAAAATARRRCKTQAQARAGWRARARVAALAVGWR